MVLQKGYIPNWCKEILVVKNLRVLYCRQTLLVISTIKKCLENFIKQELQNWKID